MHYSFFVFMSDVLVFDSMANHPPRLCVHSIRSFIGDGSIFVGINEMSKIEVVSLFQKKTAKY